jgi:hypothetical protein
MRLLLLSVWWLLSIGSMRSQGTDENHFGDVVDAIHAVRKKTIVEAYFRLDVDQFPAAPFFAPDAKGEAYFVLPVARVFATNPPTKEIEDVIAQSRSRHPMSYDSTSGRWAYYPPQVITGLRKNLAPWLLTQEQVAALPFLQFAEEVVVARIPRDQEGRFLDVMLISLYHSTRKDFKCLIGWN